MAINRPLVLLAGFCFVLFMICSAATYKGAKAEPTAQTSKRGPAAKTKLQRTRYNGASEHKQTRNGRSCTQDGDTCVIGANQCCWRSYCALDTVSNSHRCVYDFGVTQK
eukprot:GHVL01004731.1.p1 GENE.GHVL01004731.1~~GHVL01004731.1.p1  ORF type:complete len:109 (+),score=0.81 GHVL01004731.1:82-408(+)